jgi:hypothetical protein
VFDEQPVHKAPCVYQALDPCCRSASLTVVNKPRLDKPHFISSRSELSLPGDFTGHSSRPCTTDGTMPQATEARVLQFPALHVVQFLPGSGARCIAMPDDRWAFREVGESDGHPGRRADA